MRKFVNSVQDCAQGNKTTLTELYGMENPSSRLMAELWMGAHPESSSYVHDAIGDVVSPHDVTESDEATPLGDAIVRRFNELPLLFKVLCATQPPSTQIHPNKRNSEIGSTEENAAGIPTNVAERNYRDPSHKPGLVLALIPLLAMNAFREFPEIVSLLQPVTGTRPVTIHSLQQSDVERLSELFTSSLNMQGEEKSRVPAILRLALDSQQGEPWQTIRSTSEFYPRDSGLPSLLLLNMTKLNLSEAMLLFAKALHAYLQGVALEVTTNSDNVPHAGLTPKYIDISELIANVEFEAKPANQLLAQLVKQGIELDSPIPVDDFAFLLYDLSDKETTIGQQSVAILSYVEGDATLCKGSQQLQLKPDESTFIIASEPSMTVKGHGRLACVYNKLQGLTEKVNISC